MAKSLLTICPKIDWAKRQALRLGAVYGFRSAVRKGMNTFVARRPPATCVHSEAHSEHSRHTSAIAFHRRQERFCWACRVSSPDPVQILQCLDSAAVSVGALTGTHLLPIFVYWELLSNLPWWSKTVLPMVFRFIRSLQTVFCPIDCILDGYCSLLVI